MTSSPAAAASDVAGTIAVTGASGQLGKRVAARLSAAGVLVRLLVRDPTRAPVLGGEHNVAICTYADANAMRAAFDGIHTALLVSASESADRLDQHRIAIQAATEVGVRHLVYTSFQGAAEDAVFAHARLHWATEQLLRDSGTAFTALRDSFYLGIFPAFVGPDGVIRGPARDGRVAAVSHDDVADVATAVLRDPAAHVGAVYDVTGLEALTMPEIAAVLSEVAGREIRFHDETLEQARASRARYGTPDWEVEAWISTYTAIAVGELATVSDTVATIAGHPAETLREHLVANPDLWAQLRG